ncbi:hypothetical protein NDU88_004839, partial [Pleurodeles waltl]
VSVPQNRQSYQRDQAPAAYSVCAPEQAVITRESRHQQHTLSVPQYCQSYQRQQTPAA